MTQPAVQEVVFVSRRNAGASQVAAAFFNRYAAPERAWAISTGVDPAGQIHPEVRAVMHELGIDLPHTRPQPLTAELLEAATLVVTLSCCEEVPRTQGARRFDWIFPKPKQIDRDYIRHLRDDISRRVLALVTSEGWRELERKRVGV